MTKLSSIVASAKSNKDVVFGSEAHDAMLRGATTLALAVKSTMGPSGHNVIIDREMSGPLITKDGVTVAKSINLKEKLPSIGAELLKEVAAKTNEQAGDGTTTATVLAHAIFQEGVKMIASGRSSIGLKRGIDFGAANIIEHLKKNAIQIRNDNDIVSVGTISANGDRQIGELLSSAISKVSQDGIITIEAAKSFATTLEVVEGMQFDSGYVSPYFITNQEKNTFEATDPFILITNRKISALQEIVGLLEQVANSGKSLLIIGDEIEAEALHTLIVNKMRGILNACAVRAPSYGDNRQDILQDIALVTGGQVFDASNPQALKNADLSQLGTCKRVIITRNATTIVGNSSETIKKSVDERISQLRSALATDFTMDDLRRHNYKRRLAKLAGGVAVVRVGGSTETEILEKKDRVEDALNATIAAVQEGIIPGGGTALFYAATDLAADAKKIAPASFGDDEFAGIQVVVNACKAPLATIVENTGKNFGVVMHELVDPRNMICTHSQGFGDTTPDKFERNYNFGYDASKHRYGDLVEWGIIDPVKVPRFALEHAASVVGLMLTCNAVVLNEDKEEVHGE